MPINIFKKVVLPVPLRPITPASHFFECIIESIQDHPFRHSSYKLSSIQLPYLPTCSFLPAIAFVIFYPLLSPGLHFCKSINTTLGFNWSLPLVAFVSTLIPSYKYSSLSQCSTFHFQSAQIFLEKIFIVALSYIEVAPIQFPDLMAGGVKKISVVRHQQ